MDNTQNFGEYNMNLNMNNNLFFMNNPIGLNNNQMFNQNSFQNPMINQNNNSFYNINPNMFQNNNNMVLNNLMMNMNQMMMNMMVNNNQMNQNFMNNNNNNVLNDDNIHNLDKDKLNLINSIIEFYKENNIVCMNFEYPNQIKALLNLLNENYSGFKYENDIKEPLFYINGSKINIKFINSNYEVKKVNIPKSITLYDLYTIANLYKYYFYNKNILLVYKNKILNKDESSIDFISDNDNIIIIEPRYFPDDSYYKSLMKKYSNDFFNVNLILYDGRKLNKAFPTDITIGEMCKAFYLILGASNYEYIFLKYRNGFRIDPNNNTKLKEFGNFLSLEERGHEIIIGTQISMLGKQINFTIYSNDKNLTNHQNRIGILNKIEDIMIFYEAISLRRVKKIKIGEIEIKNGEDKRLCSLFSLGIIKDFNCK